jgi:hypothetical protein
MRHLAGVLFQSECGDGREGTGNAVAVKRGSLVSVAFLTGDRGFESFSLHRRVRANRQRNPSGSLSTQKIGFIPCLLQPR